jgi:two-component system cell cycle response regulator
MSLRRRFLMASALSVGAMLAAAGALAAGAGAGQSGSQAVLIGAAALALLAGAAGAVESFRALGSVVRPLEAVAAGAARANSGPLHIRLDKRATSEVRAVMTALDEAGRDLRARQRELDGTRSAVRHALTRLGDVLASTHDFAGIVEAVVEMALLVVPADAAVYYRLVAAPDHLESVHARGVSPGARLLAGTGLAGAAARARVIASITTPIPPSPPRLAGGRSVSSSLILDPADLDPVEPAAVAGVAVPIHSLGHLVGVLAVYGTSIGRPFSDDEVGLLTSLLRQVEVALANIELHEQARRDALTDGVTGLWNRRHFDIRLSEAVASSQRYGDPLSVAIFDLDDFKRINDNWDHSTGDAALVHFAGILRKATRDVDVACRWGGEEFAVLLQRAGPIDVLTIAQRVVDTVRETPLHRGHEQIPFTVSAGVASYPWDGMNGSDVVARADTALLRAKAAGKDRVERASSPIVVDVTDGGSAAITPPS